MTDTQPTPEVQACSHGQVIGWNHAGIQWSCATCLENCAGEVEQLRVQVQRLTAERDAAIARAGTIQHGDDLND